MFRWSKIKKMTSKILGNASNFYPPDFASVFKISKGVEIHNVKSNKCKAVFMKYLSMKIIGHT